MYYMCYHCRYGTGYGCSGMLHARGFNLMTRYFCGHDPVCDDICAPAALARAVRVLENEYNVVGLVDDFDDSL